MSHRDARELAAIFAGGAIGALARVALAELVVAEPATWPWATFAANVAGAFLLGLALSALPVPSIPPARLRAFAGTGVCGALTTFSAFQLELLRMLDAGALGLALAYAGGSLAAGLAVVAAGDALGRRVGAKRRTA